MTMAKQSKLKPFMWGGFTLGGIVAAFVLPALIAITNLAVPLGILPADGLVYSRMLTKFSNPVLKLIFAAVIVLTLYHAAYRLQTTFEELMLGRGRRLSWVLGYAFLIVGGGVVLYAMFLLPTGQPGLPIPLPFPVPIPGLP
jgi:fumarate reductase subunit D